MAKINPFKSATVSSSESRKANAMVEVMSAAVAENPQIANDFKKILVKNGIAVDFENQIFEVFPGDFTIPTPTDPTTPPKTENEPTGFEIDTRLQLLISSIPIANPGNIITSEYHNALRDAVRALASKIGLSVNPTAEFKILTFAPNFLPMKAKNADTQNMNWNVMLERAANPTIDADDLRKTVAGGFVIQLPDGATIHQMIVRGDRGAQAPSPKEFKVALYRQKLGTKEPAQELILVDLKGIPEGAFAEKASVKLSDSVVEIIDEDEGIASKAVNNRKTIRNEKWGYFVTAEFVPADNTAAEKFEIDSVQIFCIA